MLPFTQAGSGASALVTARSACAITVVIVVLLLLPGVGSVVVVVAVAVLVITVLFTVLTGILTTIWKTAVSPAAIVAFEKMTLPVEPTDGAEVDQPLPVVTTADTKVVFAGTASVTVTVCASDGPLLLKLIV